MEESDKPERIKTIEEIRDGVPPQEEVIYVGNDGEGHRQQEILDNQKLLTEYDELLNKTSEIVKTVISLSNSLESLEVELEDGKKKVPEILEFLQILTPSELEFVSERRPNDKLLNLFNANSKK